MKLKQQQYDDISEELKPLCEIKENLKEVDEWGKPSTFNKIKKLHADNLYGNHLFYYIIDIV